LFVTRTLRTSQNLPPPVPPQPSLLDSQVAGVVAGDVVVVEHHVGFAAARTVGLEAILAVVFQTVVRGDVSGAQEDAGTTVVDDGVVLHRPVITGVVVDRALVHGCHEVSDGQVLDHDVTGVLGERVLVLALPVEDRARRTDIGRVVARDDLVVLTSAECVDARSEPVRRATCLKSRELLFSAGTTMAPAGAVAGPSSTDALPLIVAGGKLGHDPFGTSPIRNRQRRR
jgi:hypothetical protein